ncbi:MAG: anti-sigma regulatory factor [Deltaproteobacteria bacterium]|nr:anti-sigma regulatory factor [Deltaproteobacteria bacterium]
MNKLRMIGNPDERHIVLADPWDSQHAVIETREFAAGAGFSKTDQVMISTAAAELSTNILRYAGTGELFLRIVRNMDRVGIEILAVDKGPGINNVKKALEDCYTTTKGSLGLGLPSVRRIMDEFEIESSPEEGTRITARKWRMHGKR